MIRDYSSWSSDVYVFLKINSYSMEQSHSWEANRFSASQKIPHILWNPKVHYRIYKCPATCPCLELTGSVHARSSSLCFITCYFLRRGVVSTSPTPQAGGSPLVGCPRLFIQYIRSYPPLWRPLLHPKPEDAWCRGDRDPLITEVCSYSFIKRAVGTELFSF